LRGLAPLLVLVAGCASEATRPLLEVASPPGFSSRPLADFAPADDPLTEASAGLGRLLFFDPRLSRTGQISCASCHQPERAFSDPRPVSRGVGDRAGTRNAPALVNLAFAESLFWDGRARTLEEQVTMPIENPLEMDFTVAEALQRVGRQYGAAFIQAFGQGPSEGGLRRALASFVRVLVSGGSAYDRFLAGQPLPDPARRGMEIFFGERGGCFHCHPPGSLTDQGYFNDGSYVEGGDPGRQKVTGRSGDLGKFKVPGLRNIAASAPYMHDGSLPTLEAVVDQYDRGGRGHPSTDPQITALGLSDDDKRDLIAFMLALTDDAFLHDARYRPQ
jgi:cytochrome c peroxidase